MINYDPSNYCQNKTNRRNKLEKILFISRFTIYNMDNTI